MLPAEVNSEVTGLLERLSAGDRDALDPLFGQVYRQLGGLAHGQLARLRPGDTLATTALVHETYLKLAGAGTLAARDRHHFFSLAARVMRQILIDHVRRRAADRRPDPARAISLEYVQLPAEERGDELLALDQALGRLERVQPDLARLAEQRLFAGRTLEDLAAATGRSLASLKRDWQKARLFLARELGGARRGG